MKFRKKHIEIEAVQWQPTEDGRQVGGWPKSWGKEPHKWKVGLVKQELAVETLEGVLNAWPGHWIIRGVKGEFYPCRPDIFEATYERVEP